MTGPIDPQRAREDRAAHSGALAALHAVRDDIEVRLIAMKPIRTTSGLGRMDGLKAAIDCVDQAITRRGGAA